MKWLVWGHHPKRPRSLCAAWTQKMTIINFPRWYHFFPLCACPASDGHPKPEQGWLVEAPFLKNWATLIAKEMMRERKKKKCTFWARCHYLQDLGKTFTPPPLPQSTVSRCNNNTILCSNRAFFKEEIAAIHLQEKMEVSCPGLRGETWQTQQQMRDLSCQVHSLTLSCRSQIAGDSVIFSIFFWIFSNRELWG